ncbi:nucleotidyltransferase family protein [candidate division KSB1 bacterium]|nr:nucleotidyltransferase family protein [candidate division KSB1 bacterium]
MPNPKLPVDQAKLDAFCLKWKVSEFALFGSVLRDDFGPNSDVDVLLAFEQGTDYSLFDLVDMEDELKEIFGRKVDLLLRKSVERSKNPYRRQAILSSAQTIYGSR